MSEEKKKKLLASKTLGMGSAGFCGTIRIGEFDKKKEIVPCIIDSHMHIQSGACAPLPLIYNQLPANPKSIPVVKTRAAITGFLSSKLADLIPGMPPMRDGGRLGNKDTSQIGDRSIADNHETYMYLTDSYKFAVKENISFAPANRTAVSTPPVRDNQTYLSAPSDENEDDGYVFTPMIVMPMDMEYAHIAGYDGQTIYHQENGEVFYYHRKSGIYAEELGEKVDLSHEVEKKKKTLKLKKWYRQFDEHKKSSEKHPLELICMYHYDPRRWRFGNNGITDEDKYTSGCWDYPFEEIATKTEAGIFAGFKMYTPLGYRPLDDDKLPHMIDYYKKCSDEEIPIVNHCSPGGMLTHEQPFYKDYIEKGYRYFPEKREVNSALAPDASSVYMPPVQDNQTYLSVSPEEHKAIANKWFSDNYVHPKAWRKVLDKFPKLYLNLAHFGGDDWEKGPKESDWIAELIAMLTEKDASGGLKYPNLYTDISCFSLDKNMPQFKSVMRKNEELWDKVLFGTDWYMTLLVSPKGQQHYNDYCRRMKQELDEIDDSLWIRFSFLNPMKFYGLDNIEKINNMSDQLESSGASLIKLEKFKNKFKKAIGQIETIKESL